jgi:hypothetical protein
LPLLLRPCRPPRYISDRFLHVLSLECLLSGAIPHVTLMSLPLPTSDEALRELHRFHLRPAPRTAEPKSLRILYSRSLDLGRVTRRLVDTRSHAQASRVSGVTRDTGPIDRYRPSADGL